MMFYSQFLLEKKGPLGTIWIAAHLERKLRRSQVTGTNISAAVDSIISPEVPIALRLVGHLLLGVVRIYSKKVNYLYQDCSQTLTKINRAFYPVHVDLPSDANLAPFHSITLPEFSEFGSMELDDVGFPSTSDSGPHVSTRDQITLHERHRDFARRVWFRSDECATSAGEAYTMLDFNEEAKKQISSFQLETANSGTMSSSEDVLPPLPLDGPLGFNEMDVETGDNSSSSFKIATPPIPSGELTVKDTPQDVIMEPTTGENIPDRETLRAAEEVPWLGPHSIGMDEETNAGEGSTDTGGADDAQMTEMNEPVLEDSPVPDKGVAIIQMAPPTPPTKLTLISNEEDMLASILGVSPALQLMLTPKTPASEERRPRPRKRKQSFDESIVLTNEFMRQQLTNTDDICRIRKKVPFTAIEGLNSYKVSDIQQMFLEPSLPGMSVEIQRLYKRVCTDQEENISFGEVPRELRVTSKELLEDTPESSFHPSELEEAQRAPKTTAVDTTKNLHKMEEPNDLHRESTKELTFEVQGGSNVLPLDPVIKPPTAQLTGLDVEIPCPSLAVENLNAAETVPAGEVHCVEVSMYEKEGDQGLSFLEEDSTCVGDGVCARSSPKASGGSDTNNFSTRTRAVAQYLKTAFQKSDIHAAGSKLNLERVLIKSTRKEAGRMFFEILTLKSKDYIEVEQEEAYAGILVSVKPKLYTANF